MIDTLIYITVAAANLEVPFLNGVSDVQGITTDDEIMSVYRPISQSSLARSLGLPRQTVRRRIEQMVSSGWLVISPDGVRVTRRNDLDAVKADLAVTLLNSVCRSINHMIDSDVLTVRNS